MADERLHLFCFFALRLLNRVRAQIERQHQQVYNKRYHNNGKTGAVYRAVYDGKDRFDQQKNRHDNDLIQRVQHNFPIIAHCRGGCIRIMKSSRHMEEGFWQKESGLSAKEAHTE